MIGPLILVIGVLGIWALTKGRAKAVLDAIVSADFSAGFDPSGGTTALPDGAIVPTPDNVKGPNLPGAGDTSSGTRLYTVAVNGPNGSGAGFITVVAHDIASALENAKQGGNTPTGLAIGG